MPHFLEKEFLNGWHEFRTLLDRQDEVVDLVVEEVGRVSLRFVEVRELPRGDGLPLERVLQGLFVPSLEWLGVVEILFESRGH